MSHLLLALTLMSPTRAEPVRDELAISVDRALDFLQAKQDGDGAWRHAYQKSPAVTALCVMAFLSSGHLPDEGKYGQTVTRGIRYVLNQQQPNGLFANSNQGGHEMYHHGICSLMAAEAAGMTSGELATELRKKLQKAVAIILRAQRQTGDRGGWRYSMDGYDSDLSVTGWQLLALRAAKNLGCDVPTERIEMAVDYIRRCHNPNSGAFCYQPNGRQTLPCTGTGVLCLELCGKNLHQCRESLQAGAFILKAFQSNGRGGDFGYFFYGVYYCSQACFQLGENFWRAFRPELHRILLKSQGEDGSWQKGNEAHQLGPAYCTALAVLGLTVEYRYLPIYQRHEEPAGGPDK